MIFHSFTILKIHVFLKLKLNQTMDSIKTTNQIDKNDFGISRMEDIYISNGGKAEPPHRHDHYVVILVDKAKGKHIVDFMEYNFSDKQVYFLNPGQVHQVAESEIPKGYSMFFSAQFLANHYIPINYIEDLNLFHDYGHSPPMELNEAQLDNLCNYCEEMIKNQNEEIKFKDELIASFLKLFLIQCNNHCSLPKDNPQKMEASNTILKRFKELVEKNYNQWSSTSDYAEELNITPDHLNRSIKSLIGQTAKGYIQSRINTAAKRMLYFSDLSTKEIGFQLGFSEPANFSAFFKKNTGLSPSEFRRSKKY